MVSVARLHRRHTKLFVLAVICEQVLTSNEQHMLATMLPVSSVGTHTAWRAKRTTCRQLARYGSEKMLDAIHKLSVLF